MFDEYDAGRPDAMFVIVMFVIQRVLEVSGKLRFSNQSKVIRPHPGPSGFRLFATTNVIDLSDTSGLISRHAPDGPLVNRRDTE